MSYKDFIVWPLRFLLVGLVLLALSSYQKISIYFLGEHIHGFVQYLATTLAISFVLALAMSIPKALTGFRARKVTSVKLDFKSKDGSVKTYEYAHRDSFLVTLGFMIDAAWIYPVALYVLSLVLPGNISLWGVAPTFLCGLMLAAAWALPRAIFPVRAKA